MYFNPKTYEFVQPFFYSNPFMCAYGYNSSYNTTFFCFFISGLATVAWINLVLIQWLCESIWSYYGTKTPSQSQSQSLLLSISNCLINYFKVNFLLTVSTLPKQRYFCLAHGHNVSGCNFVKLSI